MALETGTRVGVYEVTGKLGEGGMGEVYRAHDTTLDRDVALKVLSEAFTADPDRLARFQREAKVLASLNHPNIGGIYGLEAAGESQALVLELIEGPTLADRIKEGPIPVEEALTMARQIADALEVAHDQGIVHRDLKPANVKVRPDGAVKVLDFGLAKAVTSDGSGPSGSDAPTMSITGATQMGMVVGTAAYMSPEQAKGKAVDKRADVWAFGAVLYEMLTGTRAFPGDDASDTLASVLARDPALEVLPASVPEAVRRLLTRCLTKDPKKRLRDVTEGFVQLEDALAKPEVKVAPVAPPPPLKVWQQPATILGMVAVVGAIVGGVVWSQMQPEAGRVTRALLTPPPSVALAPNFVDSNIVLTPDGTRLVYRGSSGGVTQIFVRSLSEFDATPLAGLTSNPRSLFISPDGNRIGFFDGQRAIQRVSILGGPAVDLVDISGFSRGASWTEDDTIIYATADVSQGLMRISVGGGEPEVLTVPNNESGEINHTYPEILPGGEAVLFTIRVPGPIENAQIAVLSLETGEYEVLFPGGSNPRYVPSGHIVYGVSGTLRAVSFDLDSLSVTSEPFPVVDNVAMGPRGAADFTVAKDGTLAYVTGGATGAAGLNLVWIDRDGREELLPAEIGGYFGPALSPDGTLLATQRIDEGTGDIYIYDIARNNFSQFTFTPDQECCPRWTPDGQRVVFSSNRSGVPSLYIKNADGTGDVEELTEASGPQIASGWSSDGETLVLNSGGDIHTVKFGTEKATSALFETTFSENRATLSPDGNWLAYESDEDGDFDVYVRPFPDVDNGKWKVSAQGGTHPQWSPNGDELFFFSGNRMMVAPISTTPAFDAGNPSQLFEGRFSLGGFGQAYSVTPDGTRFVVTKPSTASGNEASSIQNLIGVFNWFEELRERVPTP